VQAKLSVDKLNETETVRFWYVHSRLRGNALLQMNSWVNTVMVTGAMSVGNLIAQLRIAYENSESAERAARKLSMIQQNSKPFNTFLTEFDRTILDAGGLKWSCQVKKNVFKQLFLSRTASCAGYNPDANEIPRLLLAAPYSEY
jgi:hypothetical protein